jgi:hypothetical protein
MKIRKIEKEKKTDTGVFLKFQYNKNSKYKINGCQ